MNPTNPASAPNPPGLPSSTASPPATDTFRQAMAQFATGIVVVTTITPEGVPVGMTINSFNSVSLNPPLVLWSLSQSSSKRGVFQTASHYAASILAADQEALAKHFASHPGDRFAGLNCTVGLGGCPLIPNALAHFECRIKSRYEEGDHDILVGEVLRCAVQEGPALVYRARKYLQGQ